LGLNSPLTFILVFLVLTEIYIQRIHQLMYLVASGAFKTIDDLCESHFALFREIRHAKRYFSLVLWLWLLVLIIIVVRFLFLILLAVLFSSL
jgi:hypothetical protein